MCPDFQRDSCHFHFAWSGLKLGFAKHHNSQTLFFIYLPWHFLRQNHYSQKKRINHRNFYIEVPTINRWVLKIFLPFFQLVACCFHFSPFRILPEALFNIFNNCIGIMEKIFPVESSNNRKILFQIQIYYLLLKQYLKPIESFYCECCQFSWR